MSGPSTVGLLGVAMLSGSWLFGSSPSAPKLNDTVTVMVAARDLYPGVVLQEADLRAIRIPPRFLSEGVFLQLDQVVGRRTHERIYADKWIRGPRLYSPASTQGLNAIVPVGMRAISVELAAQAVVPDLFEPGDYADVLVALPGRSGDSGPPSTAPQTTTVLQGLFVLAVNEPVDDSSEDPDPSRTIVTLLVSPEQAEQAAHAERLGELHLTLQRGDRDHYPEHLGRSLRHHLCELNREVVHLSAGRSQARHGLRFPVCEALDLTQPVGGCGYLIQPIRREVHIR